MRYVQLPASVFQANRERLTAKLPAQALAILNSNDVMPTNADGTMGFCQNSDLYYLSGIDQEETILMLFPSARDPKHREVLFVRETNELLAIWEGAKLTKAQATEVSGIETVYWTSDFDRVLTELMVEAETVYLNLNEHLRNSSEVETRDWRFVEDLRRRYPLHSYARLAPILYRLRMVKSPEEVQAIRQATVPTEAGFRRLLGFVKPGVYEYEIEAELIHEYVRGRSRGFSYPPIIASGANACVLHYVENSAECKDGDLLLLDVAAEYAYYRSDMTRTIPVNGVFTPRQKDVYNAVLRVLKACSTMLRPGLAPKDYQAEVAKIVEQELIELELFTAEDVEKQDKNSPLYRKYFMHGVSHHIGIDVHDVNDASLPFATGMVLTVEPGIYIREEDIGIRLENLIVIGEEGNEDLMATVPIEADEIEALMKK
ncbi:M24 family metallopeptidase [bacterium]|nr:MAG: M24 family metallopeptidase [bacterium]